MIFNKIIQILNITIIILPYFSHLFTNASMLNCIYKIAVYGWKFAFSMKIGSKLWENIKIILRVEYFESLGCLKRVWKKYIRFFEIFNSLASQCWCYMKLAPWAEQRLTKWIVGLLIVGKKFTFSMDRRLTQDDVPLFNRNNILREQTCKLTIEGLGKWIGD